MVDLSPQDLEARLAALNFAEKYMALNNSSRAATLRIAEHAYRFLTGISVDTINREADEYLLKIREEEKKTAPTRKKKWWFIS